jgi:hypothetical protein
VSARGLAFGALGVAIVGLSANLAREAPSPGALAAPHAELPELAGTEGCERCHAAGGLAAACASCHPAIGEQTQTGAGLHGSFAREGKGDCDACHGEHYGEGFHLVNAVAWEHRDPFAFDHPHVEFDLHGAHDRLACEQCHHEAPRTYLGLAQECEGCHENVHGADSSPECGACHTQEAFQPAAKFEHARSFPLVGAHAAVGCEECHPRSDPELVTFDRVNGTRCQDCHEDPHRVAFREDCVSCHHEDDLDFAAATSRFTAAQHVCTGFALAAPHADLACDRCHGSASGFAARYPGRKEQDCVACHADPHGGQFGARSADCRSCHKGISFTPSTITAKKHEPALHGAHRTVACARCHAPPAFGAPARFVGTASRCADCHADPHGGQFAADGKECGACHDEVRFKPARFDVARDHPPLRGAHATAKCAGCHVVPKGGAVTRFVATPTDCSSCHRDPHRGQFGARGNRCEACHDEKRFVPSLLALEEHEPPLEGAHLAVPCSACHKVEARTKSRRFVGTPNDCKACHEDPHRGQLTGPDSDCNRCHLSVERWLPVTFDHQRQSRFPLDGVHVEVACERCHPSVRDARGREAVLYKPLGTECRDCHEVR